MHELIELAKKGAAYIHDHTQIVVTLLLVLVIPVAFLFSGQQFLDAAKANQDRLEKDRIGIMHDVFASLMTATGFNDTLLQSEIEEIASLNSDITKFRVAREEPEGLRIIAALDTSRVDTYESDVASYRVAHVHPGESLIVGHADAGVRYWQSFRLVEDIEEETHYIFTETSLERIDTLFASRVRVAYYWLFGLLAIVMLLLIRHVRLIDYSYLYREMKKANETKDLFTNMIAHELRAPLTAMRGYASMIREDDKLDHSVREEGRRIEESAARLVTIVNDLLDVARIQSGRMQIEKTTINLNDTVESVIETLASSAKKKSITLKSEGLDRSIDLYTDKKRLTQALTNLVSNAIKYTNEGSITIAATDRRDRVELRVKDTGMGIAADDQKKLFAPFFRASNKDVSRITGTGLGMWITKQLIELLGGSIDVESIKDVGTHVVVTLPKH